MKTSSILALAALPGMAATGLADSCLNYNQAEQKEQQ
jgi:hypothetical protein